jgi:hypothetical protein
MDNVQNCYSYINIPSSQTYKSYKHPRPASFETRTWALSNVLGLALFQTLRIKWRFIDILTAH